MTNIIDDTYGIAEWDGADFRMVKRNDGADLGGLEVGWNQQDGDNGEVIVTVSDFFMTGRRSSVVLDKESATEVLHHLNTLLGNPLSVAPTAGA